MPSQESLATNGKHFLTSSFRSLTPRNQTHLSIYVALVKAQADADNATKNAQNPHLKNKYANLEAVLEVGKPILAARGLAVITLPAGMDGDSCKFVTQLVCNSDPTVISQEFAFPLSKADPQGVGSALTYARRYAMAAWLNITQEDDDGEAASARKKAGKAPAAQADDLAGPRVIKAFEEAQDAAAFKQATVMFTKLQPADQNAVVEYARTAKARLGLS